MYVRTKINPNSPRTAVQIVQSVRKDDRIVQKVVRHVGVATPRAPQVMLAAAHLAAGSLQLLGCHPESSAAV